MRATLGELRERVARDVAAAGNPAVSVSPLPPAWIEQARAAGTLVAGVHPGMAVLDNCVVDDPAGHPSRPRPDRDVWT